MCSGVVFRVEYGYLWVGWAVAAFDRVAWDREERRGVAEWGGEDVCARADEQPGDCRVEGVGGVGRENADGVLLVGAVDDGEREWEREGRGRAVRASSGGDGVAVLAGVPGGNDVYCDAGGGVGVGFGIRDGERARAVAKLSDAVVIGSRLVEEIEKSDATNVVTNVENFIRSIRVAIDKT